MRKVSTAFYMVSWIAAGSILTLLYLIGWRAGAGEGWVLWYSFMVMGMLPALYMWVVFIVLLYKAWSAVRDGKNSLAPGTAVGLMFVPVFNLYWMFRAVWGFAGEFNSHLSRRSLDIHRLNQKLFLSACISAVSGAFLLSIIQIYEIAVHNAPLVTGGVAFVLAVALTVLGAAVISETCRGINSLPGNTGSPEAARPPQAAEGCPGCGAPLRPGSKFCEMCGRSLAGAETKTQKQPVPAPIPRCPSCTAGVKENARFCERCGCSLQKAEAADGHSDQLGPSLSAAEKTDPYPELNEYILNQIYPAKIKTPAREAGETADAKAPPARVRIVAAGGSVRRSGDLNSFQIRVEAENQYPDGEVRGGIVVEAPAIDSGLFPKAEANAWALGAQETYLRGPGETVGQQQPQGGYVTNCLLVESVSREWKPGEKIVLDISIAAPAESLEVLARAWCARIGPDGTEAAHRDPDSPEWPDRENRRGSPAYSFTVGYLQPGTANT